MLFYMVTWMKKYTWSNLLFPRAWFGKFSHVVHNFETTSEADHSVFYYHSSFGKCVYLVVYVDDIVIPRNDDIKFFQLKQYLFNHFQTKDFGYLKYFLGIERKYALDILQETSMSNCMLVDSPMDQNMKLMVKHGEPYFDPERYKRLVGKLIYLTITRLDISFAVGVAPYVDHWVATVLCILRYIKKTPDKIYYIRIRETPIYLVIVMVIGQDLPLIDNLLQVFAYLLGEIWSLGKVRSKIMLLVLVLKENIRLWL
ncbi:putative mitochondrial protein, partial [Mucuna pruriens]